MKTHSTALPLQGPNTGSKIHFWDRTAQRYAASAIADFKGYERSLARTRDWLRKDDRVLEIGCGTGTTALQLAPSCAEYLATDLSPRMIEIARAKLAQQAVSGLRFEQADADTTLESLNGDGLAFDAVLAFNILHLVDDLDATLAHASAMLRPGGLLISKTPCIQEMHWIISAVLPVALITGLAPSVLRLQESDLIASILRQGLQVLSIERHASRGRDTRPYIVARKEPKAQASA